MLEFNEPNLRGPVAQPSNTITALFYIIVGILILNNDTSVGLSTIWVGITTIFFHSKNTLLGQWLDISSIIILIAILLFKGFPFTNLNQTNFFLGLVCILMGWILWILDIKKSKLIPKNHILTGHGIWHILTAISILFMYYSLPIH